MAASDFTRQKLCQAALDYIPTYIEQIKANHAGLDAAALASEVAPLLELQAAFQEEVAPDETVRISTAELDALDHILSQTLTLDDTRVESGDREAPLSAPEEKEKEKS